jgi:hypothetical protein
MHYLSWIEVWSAFADRASHGVLRQGGESVVHRQTQEILASESARKFDAPNTASRIWGGVIGRERPCTSPASTPDRMRVRRQMVD